MLAMSHTHRDKNKLLARVRRIAGQVAALERALENDQECQALLTQIAAARGAMHALMLEVMAGHLIGHLVEEDDPQKRQKQAQVLLNLLRRHSD